MEAAIEASHQEWEDVSGDDVDLTRTGDTELENNTSDGNNVICWKYHGDMEGLSGNNSAVTFKTGFGLFSDVDIVFNRYLVTKADTLKWTVDEDSLQDPDNGPKYIAEVATHEFGHFLGLGHLYGDADEPKSMYYSGDRDETKHATIHAKDEDGLEWIYGGGPKRVAEPSMTPGVLSLSQNIPNPFNRHWFSWFGYGVVGW